jgi:D-tyrosyl-tRNA(Tyr) deacylase
MRLCIQRVKSASVTVEGRVTGEISSRGLVVLIGIGDVDGEEGVDSDALVKWCCDKICGIKFWENESGKPWKCSLEMINAPVLLVSQFTLFTKIKSNKSLDFHRALPPVPAREMYDKIVAEMEKRIGSERTQTGEFGAMMDVALVNDGPVTVNIDSDEGK